VERAVESAVAVFHGRVLRVEEAQGSVPSPIGPGTRTVTYRSVTFKVLAAFKGKVGSEVSVATGLGGGNCGYAFERDVEYLVYAEPASGDGYPGPLYTGICQRTAPMDESDDLGHFGLLQRVPRPGLFVGLLGFVVLLFFPVVWLGARHVRRRNPAMPGQRRARIIRRH
jgi:hypothetical protein